MNQLKSVFRVGVLDISIVLNCWKSTLSINKLEKKNHDWLTHATYIIINLLVQRYGYCALQMLILL